MPRVEDLVSSPLTELATVICSPSRIHAPPSPHTSRVWNGDQFSRSRRAGIRLRIGRGAVPVVLITAPSGQLIAGTGCGAWPCLHSSAGDRQRHPPDGGKRSCLPLLREWGRNGGGSPALAGQRE